MGLLSITRRCRESVLITNEQTGEDIEVHVLAVRGQQIRLGLAAPAHYNIARVNMLTEGGCTMSVDELKGLSTKMKRFLLERFPKIHKLPIVDAAERRAGKTTRAIQFLCASPDNGLIVMHQEERQRIIWDNDLAESTQKRIFTFGDLLLPERRKGLRLPKYLWIDDLQEMLYLIFSNVSPESRLAGFSISQEGYYGQDHNLDR